MLDIYNQIHSVSAENLQFSTCFEQSIHPTLILQLDPKRLALKAIPYPRRHARQDAVKTKTWIQGEMDHLRLRETMAQRHQGKPTQRRLTYVGPRWAKL